jgi:hypothetical protein
MIRDQSYRSGGAHGTATPPASQHTPCQAPARHEWRGVAPRRAPPLTAQTASRIAAPPMGQTHEGAPRGSEPCPCVPLCPHAATPKRYQNQWKPSPPATAGRRAEATTTSSCSLLLPRRSAQLALAAPNSKRRTRGAITPATPPEPDYHHLSQPRRAHARPMRAN